MQHATASPDLSRVLVGFGITAPSRTNVGDDESATTSETKSRNEIVASYVATARVPLLAARSRELRDIAAHAAALAAANDAVRERVAAAAAAWRRARGASPKPCLCSRAARGRNTKAHASARRLEARANPRDASSAASSEPLGMVSLEDRFMALLAVGDVDLVLERFLSHEFDAAAARRVAKQIDAAATETHRTLLRDVGPAAETASVRVAELRAYARWRERTANVGLDEAAMDAAVVSAERVALAAAAAARVATETATGFRAFSRSSSARSAFWLESPPTATRRTRSRPPTPRSAARFSSGASRRTRWARSSKASRVTETRRGKTKTKIFH